jgi:hypothetical protein
MRPYIRRVESLERLKQQGTDEHFFCGSDYVIVPSAGREALAAWCRKNISNTSLPSRGATSDEAQEVYYILLGTKAGRSEFKAMAEALVPVLLEALGRATAHVTKKNFLDTSADSAFDDLSELTAFRDALVRFGRNPRKTSGDDAAVIIGGI